MNRGRHGESDLALEAVARFQFPHDVSICHIFFVQYKMKDNLSLTLFKHKENRCAHQFTIQNLNLIMLKENHQRYAKSRGTFYVQLEDDVLTKKGFVSIMKHFALEKIADKQSW